MMPASQARSGNVHPAHDLEDEDVVVLVAHEAVGEDFISAVDALAKHHAVLVVFAHPARRELVDDVRRAGAALVVAAPSPQDIFRFLDEARTVRRCFTTSGRVPCAWR